MAITTIIKLAAFDNSRPILNQTHPHPHHQQCFISTFGIKILIPKLTFALFNYQMEAEIETTENFMIQLMVRN